MNTPMKGPGVTPPPPQGTETLTSASAPTLGAIVGSLAAASVIHGFGITDAGTQVLITTSLTGLITAIFHFIGNAIGAPQLG